MDEIARLRRENELLRQVNTKLRTTGPRLKRKQITLVEGDAAVAATPATASAAPKTETEPPPSPAETEDDTSKCRKLSDTESVEMEPVRKMTQFERLIAKAKAGEELFEDDRPQELRGTLSQTISDDEGSPPAKASSSTSLDEPGRLEAPAHDDCTMLNSQIPIPIGVVVVATGQKDRVGKALPEIRWILDGRIKLWEIMQRWAIDVLKLTDKQLPKGGQGESFAYSKAGILVMGLYGPLAMEDRLSTVVNLLGIRNGHRQLAVNWPAKALPSGFGVGRNPNQKSKGNGLCKECDGKLTFRKCANDDAIRTLAICTDCDEVRGCFVVRRPRD